MSQAGTVRDAVAADLPTLRPWLRAGAAKALPGDDEAWLVLERRQGPVGCLRLRRAIGLSQPRPWYHVGCTVHAAPDLGLFKRQPTLLLGHDYTGAAELADITAAPGLDMAAAAQVQAQLVQAALARLAEAGGQDAPFVIAELPGLRDADGRSPFWQGLGARFFAGDPDEAAARHGPAWPGHVAALLPRQPVYTCLLPEPTRAALAQAHPGSLALMQVLWDAGLRYDHHVRVDDGGPVLAAPLGRPRPGQPSRMQST